MQSWGNNWKIVQKYGFLKDFLVIPEGENRHYMPEISK